MLQNAFLDDYQLACINIYNNFFVGNFLLQQEMKCKLTTVKIKT